MLKEGILKTTTLYRSVPIIFLHKYALTEKGVWTRNPGSHLVKSRSVFVPYGDLDSFEVIMYRQLECCVFHPKKGKASNGIYFDDHKGAVQMLDGYLKRKQ